VTPTQADIAVAAEATALLVERGRGELSVTPVQVMKWRQIYGGGPLPIIGPRQGGRGRVTDFAPGAAVVAAEIAIALHQHRNLNDAILTAFGEGAPVAPDGVTIAFYKGLASVEKRVQTARSMRGRPRSQVPRSLRVTTPGHRDRTGATSDEVLSALLGERAPTGEPAGLRVVDRLLSMELSSDRRTRVEEALSGLSLAGLRRILGAEDRMQLVAELAELAAQIRDLLAYKESLVPVLDATGTSALMLPDPLDLLIVALPMADAIGGLPTRGLHVSVLSLVFHSRLTTPTERQNLRDMAEAARLSLARNRAALALALALPPEWRSLMSPAPGVSALLLAGLPDDERDLLAKTLRVWLENHPDEARAIAPQHELAAETHPD
jgi:hypothetical protein